MDFPSGMGMKFAEISAEDREFMKAFIGEQFMMDLGSGHVF